jgi:hypothetical protein
LSSSQLHDWDTLWCPYRIGDEYQHFVILEVPPLAPPPHLDVVAEDTAVWDRWVLYLESKLKVLLYALESTLDARMWPKRLSAAPHSGGCAWGIGVRLRSSSSNGGGDTLMHLKSNVAKAVEEYRYAVVEMGMRGNFAYPREPGTSDPVCYLLERNDSMLPHELAPTARKRGREE